MRLIKISIILVIFILYAQFSIADSVSIQGSMKIHRMGGYVIVINYKTDDEWTDNVFFKVHCKFDKGRFTFTSSSLNNIERGWHKTEIIIPEVLKKRYGSLREYKIDLYRDGILVDAEQWR